MSWKGNMCLNHAVGRIRITYDEEDEMSEESDNEEDMWLDYTEDGGRVRSKRPKIKDVTIVNVGGAKYKCKGRFPLVEAYWTVAAKIKGDWLYSPPAYSIKQDAGLKDWHVTLLLDDCLGLLPVKKKDPVKSCLEIFCRENLRGEALTFINLESMLLRFIESEKQECSFLHCSGSNDIGKWGPDNHGIDIEECVFNSGLGATALKAVSHPELVTCVSQLLPYSFQDFLRKLDRAKLDFAQDMAESSPWEFGFRQILYNKLKMSGAEAFLSTYEKAGYLNRTPLTEKDALYIYEVLKVTAQKDGHMYMPLRKIREYYYWKKLNYTILGPTRWSKALDYLEENKVIVREEFNQDRNIFLYHNWKAEIDTVEGLETVLTQYQPDKDNMDVELSSPDFDTIRTDHGQLRASKLIRNLPIVALSGMGGCGKTTVVTNLLKHICNREEKRLTQNQTDDEMNQQLEDTNITENEEHLSSCDTTKLSTDQTLPSRSEAPEPGSDPHCSQENENLRSPSDNEDEGEKEESATQGESKEGRLRRELKEDLIKILCEKKNIDCDSMKAFKKQILLVAPTGKAARLLGCKAKLPSATIHSVVMSWRMWKEKKREEGDEATEWIYDQVKILVVDECSLLSVRLFAAIQSILIKEAKLSRIILLGDIKQLPSIEPGDFLRSVFKAFERPNFGFSVELTQNHRSESKLIVENASLISRNQLPKIDPDQRFHFIELGEDDGDNERDQEISRLLQNNADLQCHIQSQFVSFRNAHCRAINEICCKYYNRHSLLTKVGKRSREVQNFEPGDKICFSKNQRVHNHQKIIDEYIREIQPMVDSISLRQQPTTDKESQNRSLPSASRVNTTGNGLSAAEVTNLFEGNENELDETVSELRDREAKAQARRKERQARAAEQQKKWKEKHQASQSNGDKKEDNKKNSNSTSEEKLCNGEVFFIMDEKEIISEDNKSTKYLVLSDRDPILPRVVCCPERTLRKDCKMKHSWVRTIHTYQGSESSTVVYFLGNAIPQNWQHVYTAVTRGKKSVYIVGKGSQLRIAVTRKNFPRNSRLFERLGDMLNSHSEVVERLKKQRFVTSDGGNQSTFDLSICSTSENGDDSEVSISADPSSLHTVNAGNKVINDSSSSSKVLKSTVHSADKGAGDIDNAIVASDNEDDNLTTEQKSRDKSSKSTYYNIENRMASNQREFMSSSVINYGAVDSSQNQESCLSQNETNKAITRTPKKTPPRSSGGLDTPPKMARLNDTLIDTPFRDSFKDSLSLDTKEDGEDDEDPMTSTPSLRSVRRKI